MDGQFYGTEVDTFFVTNTGRCWLVASVDWLPGPEEITALPARAVFLDTTLLDIEEYARLVRGVEE